ncbi:MAG TPA: protocatechuate 3,4-dioxygenase subunit alpha [Chryseolinea sp.]|jgi:protocatechuate 3,4-dioxygenase alpha subunit|nr:protocatechuate 3,4-dioxygenase subunit alpha [Chryseolinea sp.]
MNNIDLTPSQTVGPFFAYGITAEQYGYGYTQIANNKLVSDEDANGNRIKITGRVIDGAGDPIPDAVIEIWQGDNKGSYSNPSFRGFGRVGTGTSHDNSFEFETIKPGRIGNEASHINVIVLMRGLLTHAFTRIYFSDEEEANQQDPVLNSIAIERRKTLIAQKVHDSHMVRYRFDIHMQGDNETVFFEF